RQLIRACKAATPGVACQTTVDLTRSLVEHRLTLADDSEIRLCAEGRYEVRGRPGSGLPGLDFGDWTIELVDGGLALVLDGGLFDGALPAQPDGEGGVALAGAAAVVADAASDCNRRPAPQAPRPDPRDSARVLAVARALTDRFIKRVGVDANGATQLQ